ncbi:hypothetical protein GCM10009801_51170 [Streptomyces albiaxialis]|uniref:Uncharacterized protein n=1 Tax=Streptomyces albiaxialis TaxID=329523 RepID=A0ABN2WAE7_9ACTN
MTRRENDRDDQARTLRLLDQVDSSFEFDPDATFEPGTFESVLLHGIAGDPRQPYPPAGHSYPRT